MGDGVITAEITPVESALEDAKGFLAKSNEEINVIKQATLIKPDPF